ncbi:MAG TPA: signal peptidase II [Bacteroidetes bacterium]|nr:signal peptidase II [Bacteroidota bacterium]
MQTNKIIRTLFIFILIAANVGCDQISKSIVRETVDRSEWIEVYHDNLILTNVENTGAFFGLGADMPPMLKNILLSLVPALAISVILFVVLTRRQLPRSAVVGLSFIIGGGTGNIFDRIAYGSVTDFLHMDFGVFKTGIFNMADVSIMVGMGIVLLAMYKRDAAA